MHPLRFAGRPQLLSIWMDRIRGTLSSASVLLIREDHLKQLLGGIIAYVPAQDKGHLSKVLAMLKESLDYDGQAVCQLQTALFVFQQSVSMNHGRLRKHIQSNILSWNSRIAYAMGVSTATHIPQICCSFHNIVLSVKEIHDHVIIFIKATGHTLL